MTEGDIDDIVEHHDALINGVRLHYVTAGPEDGDLVVLLHGFPEFWYSWRYQIPALVDAGYRVAALDMRGYNESEKPQDIESYEIEELVGDVVGFIDHLGADSAHVVSHDWGGAIAWALGIFQPEVIDRLVVMNAPHPAAFARNLDLEQLKRSWYVFFLQIPALPEWLMTADDGELVGDLFRNQSVNPDAFTDEDLDRYREAFCKPGAATAAINYYRAYLRAIAEPMAKSALPVVGQFFDPPGSDEIPVETLVLWGEQDEALGVEISEGLDEWVPNVRVERYADASHWVQCDVPERVNEELVGFLDA
jgi:pimeloyl-ACP methyl ester carboxylesterase